MSIRNLELINWKWTIIVESFDESAGVVQTVEISSSQITKQAMLKSKLDPL